MSTINAKRILDQVYQNLIGLQRDMRSNAEAWKSSARTVPNDTITSWMNDAAAQYLRRLAWRADDATWQKAVSMHTTLGGDYAEFKAMSAPMKAAAEALAKADKSTPKQIVAACDAMLAAVPAPQSLWPE